MWDITKVFRFEAGPRVWKQNLASGRGSEFTTGAEAPQNKCVNLHGHGYVLEVTLTSKTLNEQEMVMDFYHVKNALKKLIEDMDHSFIVDVKDPIYKDMKTLSEKFDLKLFPVNFCPTAEALAKFLYEFLSERLQEAGLLGEVWVSRVVLWETATSKAEYKGE